MRPNPQTCVPAPFAQGSSLPCRAVSDGETGAAIAAAAVANDAAQRLSCLMASTLEAALDRRCISSDQDGA